MVYLVGFKDKHFDASKSQDGAHVHHKESTIKVAIMEDEEIAD